MLAGVVQPSYRCVKCICQLRALRLQVLYTHLTTMQCICQPRASCWRGCLKS